MLKLGLLLCCISLAGISRAQPSEVKRGNVWEKAGKFEGDILLDDDTIEARNINKYKLWPKGIIPYSVDQKFDPTVQALIQEAMRQIQNVVNSYAKKNNILGEGCQILFSERNASETKYLNIRVNPVNEYCSSFVGRLHRRGPQNLDLGPECYEVHIIIHELLHALGFEHQQSAHHRDDYITIIKQNILPGLETQFKKKQSKQGFKSFGLGYDYNSIMHYSSYVFAKLGPDGDPVGPTIINKLHPNRLIEPRDRLSSKDKKKLRYMYCPLKFTKTTSED